MPNLITGLKYYPLYKKLETEEQLLEVFADLRGQYQKFKQTFEIYDGRPIKNFKHFLKLAVKENKSVILKGSGDIGGLVVHNASLDYDLSAVGALTKDWDTSRDGSCFSCHDIRRNMIAQDASEWYCSGGINPMKEDNCAKYDALIKNSKGKTARKLDALIALATK